ncbi:MAG TPA: helix-turn-helix domain-containing protein [Kofleriaceae bacterium]
MPRPRFLRATPEAQQTVLDAAVREFGEHGYDGASLNRILLAAGLSKGAFYYYFDDKADLAAAVLQRELERWHVEDVKLGKTADEFWSELERYTWDSLEQLRASPATRDVITRLGTAATRDPALIERLGPLMATAQQHVLAVWTRGQSVGAVRADIPAATLVTVVQAMKTSLAASMLPADRAATDKELEAFTRRYLDLLRRMVEPREKKGRR